MVWIDAPLFSQKSSGGLSKNVKYVIRYSGKAHCYFKYIAHKNTQGHFVKALEVTVEVANLQSELGGVQARLKFLRRIKIKDLEDNEVKTKLEEDSETKDVIENIDSNFSSKLSLEE